MKIAVIDKCPSKTVYSKYFSFDYELFHMAQVPLASKKLLKRDVTLDIDLDYYDYVILVGSEAAKEYAKIGSVSNMAGHLVNDKFIPITNPATLYFKPEGKPDFERALARLHRILEGTPESTPRGDYRGVLVPEEAMEYLQFVLENADGVVALDTETTALYPRDGYILGVSISHAEHQGRYISTDCLYDEHLAVLQQIIDKYTIVFHNMKFDIKMMEYHLSLKFKKNSTEDTMLLHYALDENNAHGLKPLALKYTDYGDYDSPLELFKETYCKTNNVLKDDFTYDLIPFDIISTYAAIDTAVTFTLYKKFKPLVANNDKLRWVYDNLLIKGTFALISVEEAGIPISAERMIAAEDYLSAAIDKARDEIYTFPEIVEFEKATKVVFNPNSVYHLRNVLFDYIGLTPTGKKTDTGANSTDAEVLEELATKHPLPGQLLKVRQMTKMKNTYISKILPELDIDGCIRTNFNLHVTTSGRLSSSGKFNAQQIPRDDPIIKACIMAPPGYKIVSQDLATAEMYYAAVLSGDRNLQEVFRSGGDFHSSIAKMVFDLPCEVGEVKKLYPSLRQSAKAISFGILYGSGPAKVSESVTKATGEYYPLERAKEDIKTYFDKFSKLSRWMKEKKKFIEENGYVYSFLGRKRRLPNVRSEDKGVVAGEVRSGINALVQSLASDINLLASIDLIDAIATEGLDAKVFGLVHDSIIALVKDEVVERYKELARYHTQKDRNGSNIPGCPIGIDQEVGLDYSFGKFEKVYELQGNKLSRLPAAAK